MIPSEAVTAMPGLSPQTCEVKIGGAWQAVSLTEAHAKHGTEVKRRLICHGRVTVAGNYMAQVRLKLAHRKNHRRCPLATRTFRGEVWPHPEALA